MEYTKKNIVGLVAIVIAIIGVFTPTSRTIIQSLRGTTNFNDLVVDTLTTGTITTTGDTVIGGNVVTVNGIDTTTETATLTSSSATLCSLQSPAATTTLVAATLRVKNTTGANEFQIGRAATASATTTLLASMNVASGLYADIVATTTETALTDSVVIPSSYINFKVATGTAGSVSFVGQCVAVFREM